MTALFIFRFILKTMYLIEKFYFSFQIFLLPEKSYQIAREIKKDKKIQIKKGGIMAS